MANIHLSPYKHTVGLIYQYLCMCGKTQVTLEDARCMNNLENMSNEKFKNLFLLSLKVFEVKVLVLQLMN